MHPLVKNKVDREVFHGRIEELFNDLREPVYLINKEDIAPLNIGEHPHQVSPFFQSRT